MKYSIDFRHLPQGAAEPVDNTYPVDFQVGDHQTAVIPEIGDLVAIPGEETGMRNRPLYGRVRSRHFRYQLGHCYVTITVEDVPDHEWSQAGG